MMSPETGEFPAQMASNVEDVSIWWRHHGFTLMACHSFTNIPLSGPMLDYGHLDPCKQIIKLKFDSNYRISHSRKCIWKCCLQNNSLNVTSHFSSWWVKWWMVWQNAGYSTFTHLPLDKMAVISQTILMNEKFFLLIKMSRKFIS